MRSIEKLRFLSISSLMSLLRT